MHSNWEFEALSRNRPILVLLGTLVLLSVFLLACTRAPSAADVEAAIAQTAAAQTEEAVTEAGIANAIGTAVAAEVATQVNAQTGGSTNEGSDLPTAVVSVSTSENPGECGPECETRVVEQARQIVAVAAANATATQDQIDAQGDMSLSAKLTADAKEAAGEKAGGFQEEQTCADETESCATNNTDSNVNVREGPGLQWPFITSIPPDDDKDTVVVICRLQSGWLNVVVSISLKINGWVSGEFMTLTGPTPDICEEIPPTPRVYPTVTPTHTPTPTNTPTVTPTPTETPKPPIFVFVFNDSSFEVCRLEVFPATNSSGSNRLGSSEILDPGETKAVSLAADAEEKNYIFKAWDCASDPDSDPPLDEAVLAIDAGMTWTMTDP